LIVAVILLLDVMVQNLDIGRVEPFSCTFNLQVQNPTVLPHGVLF
jgi:hypothetical protein